MVAYTVSNNNGYFSLNGTSNKKNITIDKKSINLGGILLNPTKNKVNKIVKPKPLVTPKKETTKTKRLQKTYELFGIIKNKKENSFLESATVYLENIKDSTIIEYTVTNKKGYFSLKGKTSEKEASLYVSYIGATTHTQKITLTENATDLGTILMDSKENMLDEVVIKSTSPIVIKKDTLEFNVASFKTKKGASVEDLLKKLPGIKVNEDGKITINGKTVNKVLVNGKPFFGNDPTIATKNLTKEIIEKVQVTDTKTKTEAFTGQKGNLSNKTINLTIKKENNKGWFGRITGGKGSNNHYEYASFINRFNNNTRLSFLTGGNDINSPSFSFGEIQKMSSSASISSFSGGRGLTQSNNTGFSYADEIQKKIDVSTNYFYNTNNSFNESKSNRENILPDNRYFSNASSSNNAMNDSHKFNTDVFINVDSTFAINIKPSFTFNNNENINLSEEETLNENNELTNKSTISSISKSDVKRFSNNINFSKKLGKKGAFITLGINNQSNKTTSKNYNDSEIEIVNSTTEIRKQLSDNNLEFSSMITRIAYRKPLISKKLFLDVGHQYSNNNNTNKRSTYDFDANTEDYTNFNTLLSTDLTYKNVINTSSLRLSFHEKKWSANVRGSYVNRAIKSTDKLRPDLNLNRRFNAFETRSWFRYKLNSMAQLFTTYSLRNRIPSTSQIQPFVNENNPLNIITGNPNLKPTNNHNYSLNYSSYNFKKGSSIFVYASFNSITNQVVSKTTINPTTLVRNTTYENINGNYNFNISGNYSIDIKLNSVTVNSLNVSFDTYYSEAKNRYFIDGIKNISHTKYISPSLRIALNINNILEVTPKYGVVFSKTTFDLNDLNPQKISTHNLTINTRTLSSKKLEWRNDMRYNYNPNVANNFNKSAWFWNSSLAYSILKDKGTISLKAYDLLNQNNNVRRIATANYIEDSQSTVLQQYFMLSFSWKFNTLGKKGTY